MVQGVTGARVKTTAGGQETERNWDKGTVVWEAGGQRDRDEELK